MAKMSWTDERVQSLVNLTAGETPVSNDTVLRASQELEVSPRSIGAKLRNMGIEVAPMETTREKSFSESEEGEIKSFVEGNSGQYTYAEVAAAVCGGKFNARQVQGKILSLELTDHVKATPKVVAEKKYSEAEEAKIVSMMKAGNFLEEISEALGKPLNSIRGKCLSLSRADDGLKIPQQRDHKAKDTSDPLTALGDVSDLTVEEIAIKISKTERGVKTMLTKRGVTAKNYDGAAKRAKADKKAEND